VSRFHPQFDVLPASQKALWPSLAGAPRLGMVLYGGTAIALRLGHRQSVDFDFFKSADLPSREVLTQIFPFLAQAKILQDERNSLTVLASPHATDGETVKLQLFGRIGFGRVGSPQLTNDGVVEVASLDDLMSTKLKVVMQRVVAKDYQDIAALTRAGVSLPRGLAAARLMYGPAFQPSESLKALTYFQGGDLDELSQLDRETLVEAVEQVRELPDIRLLDSELSVAERQRESGLEL
jgi:Nucleotidyl transferase AbiEii toxin, Type IV TA system